MDMMKFQVRKGALISFLWYILREATLYALDLFKVLPFDWMAASVITLYNLCFMWEIRMDWGANQIRNIEKVTAVLPTTSYPGPRWLLTFRCLIPMTKIVIRTDEAKAWILFFWQRLDRNGWIRRAAPVHSSVTAPPAYNAANRLWRHEWGLCWHKSERGTTSCTWLWATLYYSNCLARRFLLPCPISTWHLKMKLAFEILPPLYFIRTQTPLKESTRNAMKWLVEKYLKVLLNT